MLILGNGISRISFDERIRSYRGPIWGCNRVYLDYGEILTGIAGHSDVMQDAKRFREDHGYKYIVINDEEPLQCGVIFRKDTGTTLVAEALTRGYEVELCGFDLGGPDIYSPGHDRKNKTTWVERWRLILHKFGAEHVTFWGYNHKPFLLSNHPAIEYFRMYGRGHAHVLTQEYEKQLKAWKGDYSRIYAQVPMVSLRNKGNREWKLNECDHIILQGEAVKMPETLARKYVESYKKDFDILPLADDID